MFVMIRSFYKYEKNQYLGDSVNNFVCKESIWMIFICASISIKIEYYNLLKKIQTSEKDKLQFQFSQLTHTNPLLCFI